LNVGFVPAAGGKVDEEDEEDEDEEDEEGNRGQINILISYLIV